MSPHHLNDKPTLEVKLTYQLSLMKQAGLRITAPRRAIVQALLVGHGPFTAEELHKLITKKVCDLVTIYRCLSSLEKAGLIKRCEFGDGTTRYELQEAQSHHHHHVICRVCKKIEILNDCELQDLERFASNRGYTGVSHRLEFFGICSDCKKTT